MPNEFPNNRINFYKFHVIGNILNNIYFCQKNTDYENVEDNMTREYIAEALSTAANSDSDALVKLSRAREPPLPAGFFLFLLFLIFLKKKSILSLYLNSKK